jgi:hypothetical protein
MDDRTPSGISFWRKGVFMLRRDFVRAVVSVGLAPRLLLSQQTANPAPPPPAPERINT